MKQRSVMQHQFSQVPKAEIQRSSFDRSHGYKTTFDAGGLYPILIDEALPGDTYSVNLTGFARMATPIHPIMDNIFMETFFFSVPIRLLWDNWQKFQGERDNPEDSIDFLTPTITSPAVTGFEIGSLFDYFAVPTDVPDLEISTFWNRAYNLIWNEWFRDQNLQDSVIVDKDDGPDDPADYTILKRGKRHDYFTSCLPWPQKGDAVELPLGTSAPVVSDGTAPTFNAGGSAQTLNMVAGFIEPNWGSTPVANGPADFQNSGLEADLTNATAATINSLRLSFQIQRLLERDARGGTRYVEIIKSHFGVTSPDFRLQRPEYLGGGSSPVNITPVASTVPTDLGGATPQGNLAAIGTASLLNHGFTKSFTEHEVIIGLVNVRADLTYQRGLNRMFSRQTRYDYYMPVLAHIGEQAVLNKEIYAVGSVTPDQDDAVFGYQERFAEYRYKPSSITGKFRSTDPQSLDVWHLSQDFENLPVLGPTFIEETPPLDRVVAVPSEPKFIFDSYIKMRCARPMPMYSVPGLIDHF